MKRVKTSKKPERDCVPHKSKTPKAKHPKELRLSSKPNEDRSASLARTVLRPEIQAATAIAQYGKAYGDLDLTALVNALDEQTSAVDQGDLARGEAMLTAQAHTLDAIFNNLARRAENAEYMDNLDRYLKLALRAQSQCRATWEALATIKNPPVMGYVRQANIAHGPQQVNNEVTGSQEPSRTGENQNPQNKLMEHKNGEWLDPGATGTTSGADPEMATVGEVDGTKNRSR